MARGIISCSFAYCRIACASGCPLPCSTPAAIATNSFSFNSVVPTLTSVTLGLPSVMVPVLSITTVSILCAVSSASPDLIRIPFSAPFPVPTIIATGVASPRAHGQETTSTAIPIESANSKAAPLMSQMIAAITAIVITTGTKTPAILSAILAIGALLEPASSTR